LLRLFVSDFCGAFDRGQVTRLELFDVTAAFDSVDHLILRRRLTVFLWLSDKPFDWVRSFLSERTNCVFIHSSIFRWFPAPFGVPQGSVLCPLLYIVHTADISPLSTGVVWAFAPALFR